MIRALYFDCFGVLYVPATEAYFSRFPQFKEELYDLNKQADHGFIDRDDYITAVAKITGLSKTETAAAFSKEFVANAPLINYIRTELKPHYKIGIISNIGRGWIQDFFDEHQLHDLFDVVVMSSEEGITKPNPLIFERAAERLNIQPFESIFIDDREENCQGAEAAGMKGVIYSSFKQFHQEIAPLLN